MKKPGIKKLVLSRETLCRLEHEEIKRVAGAQTGATSCVCKEVTGCDCHTYTCFCG